MAFITPRSWVRLPPSTQDCTSNFINRIEPCGRSPARFKTPPCHGGDRGFKSHRPRQDLYSKKHLTTEQKRLLLSLALSNFTLNEGKLASNYTFAFEFLLNWMPKVNSTFQLAEKASFTNKTGSDEPVRTVLRGRGDLNP